MRKSTRITPVVNRIDMGLSLMLLAQYSLWLMTNQVDETCEQISPEIEQARRTLKQTGLIPTSRKGSGKVVSGRQVPGIGGLS